MRTHIVPLYCRSEEGGYLNNNHEWVEASWQDPVDLECNIQPYKEGKSKVILPDGVRAKDLIVLRSFTPIQIADHIDTEEGSEIEYKGNRYEVFAEEDFSSYGLLSDHFKYILKRKDEE